MSLERYTVRMNDGELVTVRRHEGLTLVAGKKARWDPPLVEQQSAANRAAAALEAMSTPNSEPAKRTDAEYVGTLQPSRRLIGTSNEVEQVSSKRPNRRKVFVSYSHKDRKWLDRLQIHLRPLERDHSLEIWDDTKIRPGTDWRSEMREAISDAGVAILLVTADFLASDYIAKNELPPLLEAAEEDGARILPIIVSPCRFDKVEKLARFQAVNDPKRPLTDLKGANRERVFIKVVDEVEAALKG